MKKMTEDEITKALNGEDWWVRLDAIRHPNAQSHHIDKALNDEDWHVRRAAVWSQRVQHHHIDKALNGTDWNVRLEAYYHNLTTNDQKLEYQLKYGDIDV